MKHSRLLGTVMVGIVLLAIVPARVGSQGPFVSEPVTPKLSPNVRDLPTIDLHRDAGPFREVNPRRMVAAGDSMDDEVAIDPLLDRSGSGGFARTPSPIQDFEGVSAASIGAAWTPPDPNGDVGPNHYVQMVNMAFQIFDKSGATLAGPTDVNHLWTGQGGLCEANNDGDPIVLYDPLADRWLLSQFAVPNPYAVCVAISQTADPTGAYYLYEFSVPAFPDYLKFGVWPDAYYMSANEASYSAYAFDRANMLAGNPATYQRFTGIANFMLPSDLDGATPPPVDSPNYFYTYKDNDYHGGVDRLEIYEFHVDWAVPGNSAFTLVTSIPVSAFTYTVCGFFILSCVPQSGTPQKLDALSEWPMFRLAYRNFGTHESLVGNFTVDVGSDQAGIRWFELRKVGASPWALYQEGTHAPDAAHRWNGSIAMDKDGNIALGYSVSSSTMYPDIRYATRLAGDSLGTLQTEVTLTTGGGSQTGSNRWGDYSAMSVDPTDDCTFWYTNEYYGSSSPASWQTRIGSFKMPECTADPDFAIDAEPASQGVCVPSDAVYTVTVEALQGYSDTVTLGVSGNPVGTSTAFSVNPVTPPATPTLTIGDTDAAAIGTYTLTIAGVGPTQTHTTTVQLDLFDAVPAVPVSTGPIDGSTGVGTTPTFTWMAVPRALSYEVEVATDLAFSSVVISATGLTDLTYTPGSALSADTVHYWRVRANNGCGSSTWSAVSAFRTRAALSCTDVIADGGFENGPHQDWSASSALGRTIITGAHPRNGAYSAQMGGVNNETGQVWQTVAIPASAVSATLRYWYEIDSGDWCGYDYGYMRINGSNVHVYDLCSSANTGGYVQSAEVDMTGYKGTSPEIRFRATTDFLYVSTFYVDDVELEVCEEGAATVADYSDLPGSYGVAWHTGGGALRLGASWDADTSFADGDDDGSDDGVSRDLLDEWEPGQVVTTTVNVIGGSGYLVGWLDWNGDGDFGDAGEKAVAQGVSAGANAVTFTVPLGGGYTAGRQVSARFRLYASDPGGSETPGGGVGAGEVEDYTWGFENSVVVLPLVLRDGN